MFSVGRSAALLLFLLVPFYLKYKYGPAREPFPAVMMPVGAYKLTCNSGAFVVRYRSIYGMDKNGAWQRLNPDVFLKPLPRQYFSILAESDFGFTKDGKGPGGAAMTHTDSSQIRNWLQQRLQAQGLNTTILKKVLAAKTIDEHTKTTVSEKIIYEAVIRLDQ